MDTKEAIDIITKSIDYGKPNRRLLNKAINYLRDCSFKYERFCKWIQDTEKIIGDRNTNGS
jgi:hypothetical protein